MLRIFFLALAVRLLHVWQIAQAPFWSVYVGDARAYDRWAQQIAAGDWIGRDVFYQAPLYPYLLGLLYTIAGRHHVLTLILQAIGGSLAAILLASAGSRLFSKRAGLICGVLLAISPAAIFFDGLVQKTALEALLMCLALWQISRLMDAPERLPRWLALGLTLGALALSRENALVLVVVIVAWAFFEARKKTVVGSGFSPSYKPAAALLFGVSLLLVPVAIRNAAVSGGLYLTTAQFGPNFYIGNNASANGMYRPLKAGRGTAEFERTDAIDLAQTATGRTLTPAAVSRYWTTRAFEFIAAEPRAWSALLLRKTALFINAVEVADAESQEGYAEWSLPLRLTAPIGHAGVLIPLALLGLWRVRSRWRDIWILPALAIVYAGTVVLFYVMARYRHPLTPILILFAAAALASPAAWLSEWRRRPLQGGVVLTLVAIVAAVANWPIVSHASMHAVGENNLGVALQADGQVDAARDHFRRAAALDSSDVAAMLNLGTSLAMTGRAPEAADVFAQAVTAHPESGDAHYFLGKELIARGDRTGAIAHLRAALQTLPESLAARTSLGLALASAERFDEAIVEFREVTRRDPAFTNASWNLGTALLAAGKLDEAAPCLEDAIRRDPANQGAKSDLADLHNRRGIQFAVGGARAEAVREFERALALDPGFADARQNLATATHDAIPPVHEARVPH